MPFESLIWPLLYYRYHIFGASVLAALLTAATRRQQAMFHLRWAAVFGIAALLQGSLMSAVGFLGALGWLLVAFLPVILALAYLVSMLRGGPRSVPAAAGPQAASSAAAAPPASASRAGAPQPVAARPVPLAASSQPAAPQLLKIRSVAEEHLYMDLHPCACGEADWRQLKGVQRYVADELVKVFEGPCPRCGAARQFLFIVPEVPFFAAVGYGGPEPSAILDAGQFLTESDRWVRSVPASTAGLDEAARKQALARMAWGVAAMEEVIKFIPPGADAMPEAALLSSESVRHVRELPGQFRRLRLEARLQAYREILGKLQASAGA